MNKQNHILVSFILKLSTNNVLIVFTKIKLLLVLKVNFNINIVKIPLASSINENMRKSNQVKASSITYTTIKYHICRDQHEKNYFGCDVSTN